MAELPRHSSGNDRIGYRWDEHPGGDFRWEAWTPHESGVGFEASKQDAEFAIAQWFREQTVRDFPELQHG